MKRVLQLPVQFCVLMLLVLLQLAPCQGTPIGRRLFGTAACLNARLEELEEIYPDRMGCDQLIAKDAIHEHAVLCGNPSCFRVFQFDLYPHCNRLDLKEDLHHTCNGSIKTYAGPLLMVTMIVAALSTFI